MRVDLIMDGQFGSTGKGKLSHWMLTHRHYDINICDNMPNAGHTAVFNGEKHVLRQLPMGACIPDPKLLLVLGSGCAIDVDQLMVEIRKYGVGDRLMIHPNALIVEQKHVETEAVTTRHIASTMKGCGEALACKIRRSESSQVKLARDIMSLGGAVSRYEKDWPNILSGSYQVLAESAQGWGLSLDSKFYPYTTSRNINPAAALDRMNLHPRHLRNTVACYRTFPIRVGNVPGGHSGGFYPDQREMSFQELAVPEEKTTVTGRTRRIFSWSARMFQESLAVIQPNHIFINFMNYLPEDLWHAFIQDVANDYILSSINHHFDFNPKILIGTGPDVEEMKAYSLSNRTFGPVGTTGDLYAR